MLLLLRLLQLWLWVTIPGSSFYTQLSPFPQIHKNTYGNAIKRKNTATGGADEDISGIPHEKLSRSVNWVSSFQLCAGFLLGDVCTVFGRKLSVVLLSFCDGETRIFIAFTLSPIERSHMMNGQLTEKFALMLWKATACKWMKKPKLRKKLEAISKTFN